MSKPYEQPWPRCDYQYHRLNGSTQCSHGAEFSVMEVAQLETRLACTLHLADIVNGLIIALTEEPYGDGEHPVLVRQLHKGDTGWPISRE